jgi:hypothetical protein
LRQQRRDAEAHLTGGVLGLPLTSQGERVGGFRGPWGARGPCGAHGTARRGAPEALDPRERATCAQPRPGRGGARHRGGGAARAARGHSRTVATLPWCGGRTNPSLPRPARPPQDDIAWAKVSGWPW